MLHVFLLKILDFKTLLKNRFEGAAEGAPMDAPPTDLFLVDYALDLEVRFETDIFEYQLSQNRTSVVHIRLEFD